MGDKQWFHTSHSTTRYSGKTSQNTIWYSRKDCLPTRSIVWRKGFPSQRRHWIRCVLFWTARFQILSGTIRPNNWHWYITLLICISLTLSTLWYIIGLDKKDRVITWLHGEPPDSCRYRGVLSAYRADFWGWLPSVIAVQPFANEVSNNICHDGHKKR